MTKKILLLLFIAISSSQIVDAQITKGTYSIGGQIGYSRSETKYETTPNENRASSVVFSANVGKAVKENLIIGVGLSYNAYQSRYEDDKTKNYQIGGEVFMRQYLPVANRFYLYGHVGIAGQYLYRDYPDLQLRQKTTGYILGLSVTPGVSYALKKNIHLESGLSSLASVNYMHERTRTIDNFGILRTNKSNQLSIGAGLTGQSTLFIGLRVFI